jgi:peptidoglycan/LPS O-acetylase OafA/YrhL
MRYIENMITQKRTLVFVLAALALLLVPFFAMQFNVAGWDWDATDFVIMAVLLSLAGFALAAATNSEFSLKRRLISIGIVGLLFILYVHLAVGIVDTLPLAGS